MPLIKSPEAFEQLVEAHASYPCEEELYAKGQGHNT